MDKPFEQFLSELHEWRAQEPRCLEELLGEQERTGDGEARLAAFKANGELAVLLALALKPRRLPPADAAQDGIVLLRRILDRPEPPRATHEVIYSLIEQLRTAFKASVE